MSFLKYWFADLLSYVSESHDVYVLSEFDDLIPNLPPKSVYSELDSSMYLCDSRGEIVIELKQKKEILTNHKYLKVFTQKGSIFPYADLKYVQLAHESLNYECPYLLGDSKIHFLAPGSGTLSSSKEKYSILIGIPIYKRFNLTKVFYTYMTKYLIPSLVWKDFDVKAVFVGEEEDLKGLQECREPRVVRSCLPNNLGDKKNAILEYAKVIEADYLLWIDSDDFFHPETIVDLIEIAKCNGFWSAIKPFCFYATDQQTFGHFEGYAQGHNLESWGMGSGRVFTKELLTHMSSGFSKGNRSMDQSIKGALQDLEIDATERLLTDPTHLPIGVKTAQNIWAAKSYNTKDMRNPKWLPYDIWEQIEKLSFDDD